MTARTAAPPLRPNRPNPEDFRSWQDFAQRLLQYMEARPNPLAQSQPVPLSLAHADSGIVEEMGGTITVLAGELPRATEDGLLLFDPVLDAVVVSREMSWRPLMDAAFGGMRMSAAPTAGANLTTAWQQLTLFDTVIPRLYHTTFDPVTDTFSFDTEGVYQFNINIGLDHNSSGQSRTIDVRLYNETTATPGRVWYTNLGTGLTSTQFNVAMIVEIPDTFLNDVFRIEASAQNGDVTSVVWVQQDISVSRVGPIP